MDEQQIEVLRVIQSFCDQSIKDIKAGFELIQVDKDYLLKYINKLIFKEDD